MSFALSDLMPPQGRRQTFAQVYTLDPEVAIDVREENISDVLRKSIKRAILERLERLMRENPFGKGFKTMSDKVEEAMKNNNGQVPEFQVSLF